MRFLLFIVLSVFVANTVNAQDCNCKSNFEWMKKTFEENDAGFQYIINKKGQAAYDMHNKIISKKIKSAKTLSDCSDVMNEWLKFFRSGHIGVRPIMVEPTKGEKAEIPKYNIDIAEFEKYISEKKELDFEGIWTNEKFKHKNRIGIKKEGMNYIAFKIDSTQMSGQIILRMTKDGDELKTIYFSKNLSPYKIPSPKLIGTDYIEFGKWSKWKRLGSVSSKITKNSVDENYSKFKDASKPYLDELNSSTLYFRIPSFNINQKAAIDSVITANKDKILKTKNLIIDIRNGNGGTDNSYKELLPFLYTNPIRTPGMEFLSTKLNNKGLEDVMASPQFKSFDEKAQKEISDMYEKLKNKLGEFVLVDKEVNIKQQDTIYEYPKNIGIIINHQNVSADEGFLLEAKQSKKVKLFGNTTFGAYDISNVNTIESPCKEFLFRYSMSKSIAISELTIDEIGIQPDYYIDKSIPDNKWVNFVNDILNK